MNKKLPKWMNTALKSSIYKLKNTPVVLTKPLEESDFNKVELELIKLVYDLDSPVRVINSHIVKKGKKEYFLVTPETRLKDNYVRLLTRKGYLKEMGLVPYHAVDLDQKNLKEDLEVYRKWKARRKCQTKKNSTN